MDSASVIGTMEMDLESWQEVLVSQSASKNVKYEVDLSMPVKRNIARFFIENGIDSSAASSASFKTMVDAIIARTGGSSGFEIPSCDELSSLIQDEMKDIYHYVKEIGMMKTMRRVWSQANTITNFIYSDETLLRLVKEHTHGRGLIMSSRIKATIPFLTLENIVSENENLMIFFDSSTWKTSNWAHTAKGRELSNVVEDPTFWTEASLVLRATIPLVRSLLLVNGGHDNPLVPIIYETMDQVKETIKKEFRNKNYIPFWDAIDEIWDNILHSPLHSAGYFLNPSLHYSSDFSSDSEVATGLVSCIVRMVEVHKTQDRITQQIEKYGRAMGTFGEKLAVDDNTIVPPVTWWSLYGGQCPELQKVAIRILSQTCCGASRYNLRRSSSEQLRTEGRKCAEQERLNDQMFVEHNARLQHSLSVENNSNSNFVLEYTQELNNFVMVAEQELNTERDDSAWSDTDEAIILRGVVNSFELQDEPTFGLVMIGRQ
ncbi:Hat transposon superfamily protein [Thalictrum thalictroides]|uniref:Hat transposon superfamily protein n=1 Tax=Thalictrum thalictroides TaxID=46969 RepID=A0A7J6VEZ2_THATH|nr:Hat transposon superfamily protein [Thalictrum thalictroides]